MVEEHSPEFIDAGEKQKIDFFEGDVHLGHYTRFDFDNKSISQYRKMALVEEYILKKYFKNLDLLEDEDFRPVELRKYAETDRFIFGVQLS